MVEDIEVLFERVELLSTAVTELYARFDQVNEGVKMALALAEANSQILSAQHPLHLAN